MVVKKKKARKSVFKCVCAPVLFPVHKECSQCCMCRDQYFLFFLSLRLCTYSSCLAVGERGSQNRCLVIWTQFVQWFSFFFFSTHISTHFAVGGCGSRNMLTVFPVLYLQGFFLSAPMFCSECKRKQEHLNSFPSTVFAGVFFSVCPYVLQWVQEEAGTC